MLHWCGVYRVRHSRRLSHRRETCPWNRRLYASNNVQCVHQRLMPIRHPRPNHKGVRPDAPIRPITLHTVSLSDITWLLPLTQFNFPPSTAYPPPRLIFPSEYASHRRTNININRNCETCCLLLSKLHGKLCVVMMLLILKQHSTSDACTMDEEELLVQFTEERYIITLKWVCCPVSLR
jgi:hypothetical protein